MDDMLNSLTSLLTNQVLPTLRTLQHNQTRQFDENEALNAAITELRNYINLQFNQLNERLKQNYTELHALNEALLLLKLELATISKKQNNLIH